jgi:hypothetical protein
VAHQAFRRDQILGRAELRPKSQRRIVIARIIAIILLRSTGLDQSQAGANKRLSAFRPFVVRAPHPAGFAAWGFSFPV